MVISFITLAVDGDLEKKKSYTYHKTFYYQKGKKPSYKRQTGEQTPDWHKRERNWLELTQTTSSWRKLEIVLSLNRADTIVF